MSALYFRVDVFLVQLWSGTEAVGLYNAVFRLVEGPVTFVDTNKHERRGTQYLEPIKTIRQGRPFGFPFPDPFTFT